ncbi:MarC family protein [candidate division KSB1 bacterium]
MDNLWMFSISVFAGFFAIMNPIANVPIFVGLTEKTDKKSKLKIAKTATITAFIIVAVFIIIGKYIFEIFGLTIPAFKITGGILVFYVGFEMLQSKKSSVHHQNNIDYNEGISISPLATPILAGPGTIVTAMNFTTSASFFHIFIILLIFLFMIIMTYLAFISSDFLVKIVGRNKIVVIGKIMGLIIGIIGTNMVVEGIKMAFT